MLATPPWSREVSPPVRSRTEPTLRTVARLATPSGTVLATGMLHLTPGGAATLTSLDRPGAVAVAYFVDGLRDVTFPRRPRSVCTPHRYPVQREERARLQVADR